MAPPHGLPAQLSVGIGLPELLVIFALVLVVFGASRLRPR
jgi:hypothetical protein